jgi:regulator of protease activity HflC (stomatin/prohibitin superfamily)
MFNFSFVIGLCLFTVTQSMWVTVPTGSVAVFRKFGELIETVGDSGLNWYNPITTSYEIYDTNSQTDEVVDTSCISQDMQLVIFPKVFVVNRLPKPRVVPVISVFEKPRSYENPKGVPYDLENIYKPVTQYLKEMCSKHTGEQLRSDMYGELNEMIKSHLISVQKNREELNGEDTGIIIISVTVDVPKLDKDVEKNYQSISKQKTATRAEEARQETELKKADTEKKLMEVAAERERSIAATKNMQMVDKERSDSDIEKIRATSQADKSRIEADALSYSNHQRAKDNEILLTPEYLLLQQVESYGCQNMIHYGALPAFLPANSVPNLNSKNKEQGKVDVPQGA